MKSFNFRKILVIIVLAITIIAITIYLIKINQPFSVNKIVIQDDYFFEITIPKGFWLEKGDFSDRIKNAENYDRYPEFMAFTYLAPDGEGSKANGYINLDGVEFEIINRSDIGCDAILYPTKAKYKFSPATLYLSISASRPYSGCQTYNESKKLIYENIIKSIKFGSKLKEVLLGNADPPVFNRHH